MSVTPLRQPVVPAEALAALERALMEALPDTLPTLLAELHRLTLIGQRRYLTPAPAPLAEAEDRLLTAPEAAERLNRSTDFVYRHAASLPFTVRDGRAVRFSARGLERFIRTRMGR
jgi:Helix-turn-helix domain